MTTMRIARKRKSKPARKRMTQLERVAALNARGDVTVEEFHDLDEDEGPYRLELIDGVIDVTSSPTLRHQRVVGHFLRYLSESLDDTGKGTVTFDLDTILDAHSSPRPDIIFVSRKRSRILGERIYGSPDLVVEVLSPSTRSKDLGRKKRKYASCGIPSYWIADPEKNTIDFLRLDGKKYVLAASAASPAVARPPGFRGLRLPLAKIFAP